MDPSFGMRPEKALLNVQYEEQDDQRNPVVVYGIITDWVDQVVDFIRLAQDRIRSALERGHMGAVPERDYLFKIARRLLSDFIGDVNLLTQHFPNPCRKMYVHDAEEIKIHLYQVRNAIRPEVPFADLLHLMHVGAVENILALVNERADFALKYEEQRVRWWETQKEFDSSLRAALEEELTQSQAIFKAKQAAARTKEKTLHVIAV